MDLESFLKQKIPELKLPSAPFGVSQLEEAFAELDAKGSGLVDAEGLKSVLRKLKLSDDEVRKHTADFFGRWDPKKTGTIHYKDFVREWSRYQLFWSLRHLYSKQQQEGNDPDATISAALVQTVFTRQLGEVHGTYAWNNLVSTTTEDGKSRDFSIREIAKWYFGLVKHKSPHFLRRSALLVIDVQNDFLPPSGSLAVTDGDKVIPIINDLRQRVHFNLVAHTQDFHPADHISFASNNQDDPECKLFTPLKLKNGHIQVMWPDHCVQGSNGCEFSKDLVIDRRADKIVQKGKNREVDSYSGFYDNDHKQQTELAGVLKKAGITDVYCTGLAYDYCVGYSALDASEEGFRVTLVEDATRGVAPDSTKAMKEKLLQTGIHIIQSKDVPYHGFVQD